MAEHPGIVFKDGPSGRRAALAFGPDVWEIVKVLRELDERGSAAVTTAAELLVVTEAKVRLATHYYAAHPDEIDAEIDEADRVSAAAEAAWRAEQRLLRERAQRANRSDSRALPPERAKRRSGVSIGLLLDEMHAPMVATELCDRGHDVLAVADQLELRALSDPELCTWAGNMPDELSPRT